MKKLILLIFLLPFWVIAQTNYYISPTGDDGIGDGSLGNPWFGIGYASTQMSTGDTLFVRGGTYDYGGTQNINVSGTAGNEVVFINYPDEEPVFDFWSWDKSLLPVTSMHGIRISNRSHVKLIGLHVRRLWKINLDNGRAHGYYIRFSNNITLETCKADSIAGVGFFAFYSRNIYHYNCDAWWCADPQNPGYQPGGNGMGFHTSGAGSYSLAYTPNPGPITAISNSDVVFRDDFNAFWINAALEPRIESFTFQDNGVEIEVVLGSEVESGPPWRGSLRYLWRFYQVSTSTLLDEVVRGKGTMGDSLYYYGCRAWLTSDQGFAGRGWKYAIYDNCWAFNNNLQHLGYTDGDEHGFKYMLDPTDNHIDSIGIKIINSIAAYNNGYGFHENSNWARPNSRIYNNLAAYSYGRGFFAGNNWHSNAEEGQNIYRNNIGYNPNNSEQSQRYDFQSIVDHRPLLSHNSWDCPVAQTYPNCGGISEESPFVGKYYYSPSWVNDSQFLAVPGSEQANLDIMSAPRQADGSLPDLGDYWKLAPTSDFIDAGVDVGLPYTGTAPDLGPFQYVASGEPDPDPPIISDLLLMWEEYTFTPLFGLVQTTTIINAYNDNWVDIADNLYLLKMIAETERETDLDWNDTELVMIDFSMRAMDIRNAINQNNQMLFQNMEYAYNGVLEIPGVESIPGFDEVFEPTTLTTPSPQQFVGLFNWNIGILIWNTQMIFDELSFLYPPF